MSNVKKYVKPPKKRVKIDEFPKLMVFLNWIALVGWITASYTLAFFDKSSNETVTVAVATSCLGTMIGYFIQNTQKIKSANENNINAKTGEPHKINEGSEYID